MYMYEELPTGEWITGPNGEQRQAMHYCVMFCLGSQSYTESRFATAEEAAARVAYLNGGLHPELTAMALRLLPALFKDELIDPRAYAPQKCVHGRLLTEPCELCDDPEGLPGLFRQGAGPI